jgi:glycosyltransferase involved in cell wall biosynthesis
VTALLQCAKFFVFPSLYEGFGLPALEAMQFKIPVLTSRTGSLCEVVGDSALLVDPLDTDDIARGIRQLNADSDLRADLSRRGPIQAAKFSEKAYAHRLREAYAKVGVLFPNQGAKAKPEPATVA